MQPSTGRPGSSSTQASLAAKLSASQLIDQEEALLPPPPSAAASAPPGTTSGDDLGLPSHLWAALEQRWGASGEPAGEALEGGVLLSVDDEMDRHPCMVPLVLMLERACQLEDGPIGAQPPEWAAALLRVLQGAEPAVSRCAGLKGNDNDMRGVFA